MPGERAEEGRREQAKKGKVVEQPQVARVRREAAHERGVRQGLKQEEDVRHQDGDRRAVHYAAHHRGVLLDELGQVIQAIRCRAWGGGETYGVNTGVRVEAWWVRLASHLYKRRQRGGRCSR